MKILGGVAGLLFVASAVSAFGPRGNEYRIDIKVAPDAGAETWHCDADVHDPSGRRVTTPRIDTRWGQPAAESAESRPPVVARLSFDAGRAVCSVEILDGKGRTMAMKSTSRSRGNG